MAKTKHFGPLAAAAGAVVAVALLVLALVVNPQPAKAAFPGQNGRIAFASDRNATPNNLDNYDIYTISSTGTGTFQRTSDPAREVEPAYSPNGNKIAFQSKPQGGTYDIWTVNSTGTPNPKRITNNSADDRDPNWSPDGSKIVFSSKRGSNEQIWTVSSAGVNSAGMEVGLDQITDAPFDHRRPAYAPNGNRIVFQNVGGVDPVPNWNIWTINSDGNPRSYERVTRHPADDEEPAYSPDGSRIAFSSSRFIPSDNVQIYTASPSGVEDDVDQITEVFFPSPAIDEKPAFSPDGSKIVFDSNRSGNYDIWIINCSFQRPTYTRITDNPATDFAADWQSLP
jgi:Tol biopolymer transport system component